MKRCLLCLLLIAAATSALAQEKKVAPQLPGGGVADPAGKLGFFPNTTGGIDALDLATGKLLWSTKDANRPLAATDDRLFAQAGSLNEIRVFVLNTKDGKRIVESAPIKMPYWVSVQTAYGLSFRSGARVEGKALLLSWEAHASYAGGARPTPAIEKAARKDAAGVARVDLETGKVEALDADKIAAGKFFPMPAAAVNSKAGTLTLGIKDGPAKNAKNPFQMQRTLQAMNQANEMVWQHEIAAQIFLPPRP